MVDNVQTQVLFPCLIHPINIRRSQFSDAKDREEIFQFECHGYRSQHLAWTPGIYIAKNTAPDYHPAFYQQVRDDFKGNYDSYINKVFNQSIFTDSTRYMNLLLNHRGPCREKLTTDPLVVIYSDFSRKLLFNVYKQEDSLNRELIDYTGNICRARWPWIPTGCFTPMLIYHASGIWEGGGL